MNIRALRAAKRAILEEPRRLDMSQWGLKVGRKVSPCGTTACIAGWVVIEHNHISLANTLKAKTTFNSAMQTAQADAQQILDIDDAQADRLFYVPSWPRQFKTQYNETLLSRPDNATAKQNAAIQQQLANITARRIEYFIKTGGRDEAVAVE